MCKNTNISDEFKFYYDDIADGYKMVSNAVPVMLAYHVAESIKIVYEIDNNLFHQLHYNTQIKQAYQYKYRYACILYTCEYCYFV